MAAEGILSPVKGFPYGPRAGNKGNTGGPQGSLLSLTREQMVSANDPFGERKRQAVTCC